MHADRRGACANLIRYNVRTFQKLLRSIITHRICQAILPLNEPSFLSPRVVVVLIK